MKLILSSIFISTSLFAQTPSIERTDLFEEGKSGYATYRIPDIVATAKGSILAWCEARKSGWGVGRY